MNQISEADKRRYWAVLEAWGIVPSRRVGRAAAGVNRREFLRGVVGGAAGLALTGAAAPLLTGCGGGNGELDNPQPIPATSRLLISTFLNGTVESFRASDGASLGTFFPAQSAGVTTAGVIPGPANNLFIFSPGSDRFFMYDRTTGTLLRTITGVTTPHTGAIGPDGNLYVVNAPSLNGNTGLGPDTVEVYDGETAERIRTFAEIRAPFGCAWGPDGNLYVSSTLAYSPLPPDSDYITRLNGQTGASEGILVRDIKVPFNMTFHPDGDLLVVEHFNSRVNKFNIENGQIRDSYADVPFALGLAFGPDGHLYISSFTDLDGFTQILNGNAAAALGRGRVLKFDGNNGKPLGTALSGLPFAGYIAFV